MPATLGTIFNAASMTPPNPTSSPVPVGEAASCAQHVTTTNPHHHHHHHHHTEDENHLNPSSQPQQQLCLRCAYPISNDRSVYDVIKCLPDMLSHVGYAVQRLVVDSGRGDSTSVSLTIQPTRKRARSLDVGVVTAPQVSQPHSSPQERPMKRLAVPSVPAQAASSCRICVSSCCSTNSLCKARICGHRNEEVSHPTSPSQQHPHPSRPPSAVNRQDTLDRSTTQQPQHHHQTLSTHSRQIRPSKRTQSQQQPSQQQQQSNRQNQQQDHHQTHSITPQQPQQQQQNTSTPNHQRATTDHPLGGVSTTAPLHNKTRSGHAHSHQRAHSHSCGRIARTHQRMRQNVPTSSNPYTSTQPTQRHLPVHELLPLPDMATTRDHDENASPAATAAAAVEAATVALASQTPLAAHAHPTRDSAGAWTNTTAPVAATVVASAAAMGHASGVYDTVSGRMAEGLAAELTGDPPTGNHSQPERRRRSRNANEAAAVAAAIENQSAPVTQTVDTTNQNDGTGGNDRGNGTTTGATASIRPPPELLCSPCNIRFDIELDLRRHQFNEHKDDKTMTKAISKTSGGRFLCLMHSCPQSFVRRHVMERHFKTVHLKLKEFHCPSCDHAFADSSTRDAHRVAVHEKRKPWQCDTCSKTFTQSSSLGKHRRRFHSQTTTTTTAANAGATNVNVADAAQQ